jgi:hypothetical protein
MTSLSLLDQPPDNDQSAGSELLVAPAGWPAPPDRAVYHELPGEIVSRIAPHTEADPVAILTQLLVCCGAAVGRGAYFQVEATRHHPNQFLLLIGDSSRARICCAQHIRAYGAPQPMLRRRVPGVVKRRSG